MTQDNTSAHTAGPWTIEAVEGYGFRIKEWNGDAKEDSANARVIAAAPELLEACSSMLAELRWLRDNKAAEYDALILERAGFSDAWDKMKSAISKAS